jgi:mono/diheme cytochrome c family protein
VTLRLPSWLGLGLALGSAIASHPVLVAGSPERPQSRAEPPQAAHAAPEAALDRYCVTCHNARLKTGGLLLDQANRANVGADAETWEKVVRRLRAGTMPPQGSPRPDRATYDALIGWLEPSLDRAAAARPAPGRPLLHRVNRVEYANAVRDLLAVEVDAAALLPPDDAGFGGFDNIADVLGVSPLLQERYLVAAQKISAAAVGSPELAIPVDTKYQVPGDRTQTKHIDGLPLGTRGGVLIQHTFPVDGEYLIAPKLWKTNNWVIRGITQRNELEITIDGQRVHLAAVGGPQEEARYPDDPMGLVKDTDLSPEDINNRIFERLQVRLPVKAGRHAVGVAFVYQSVGQEPQLLQPLESRVDAVDAAGVPQVDFVMISGPLKSQGAGDTPSRRRIFTCRPTSRADEARCARRILTTLARRAYRQPPAPADIESLLKFYESGRQEQGQFETGIHVAIQRMLSDPKFIFRAEQDPPGAAPGTVHRVSPLELASRLSFFLWSSIPDDELLNLAISGQLHQPRVFEAQVRRMLADPRARALVSNFAGQWLYVRNLKGTSPDRMEFADFDDNLRQSFQRETELFFESIMREDRNVLDLMTADYTFVDERLARHYGIPKVYGSRFRRVTVPDETRRGLLGKGSILAVTSRAERTSPVLRGKWILENLLGSPPPPPPAAVPPFPETSGEQPRTVRERLEQHRANPVCANCHRLMDPLGLALENFDAVGAWRTREGGSPIDPSGRIFDGTTVDGPVALRQALLSRPETFVGTLTEKLLTYALGRALVYQDMPTVRAIVREAARSDYRFSAIVLGVATSTPFQMRSTPEATDRPNQRASR